MASSSRSHQHQEAELDGDHIASPLLPSISRRSPERDEEEEGENSPVEQVALTVPVGDDPDTPVPTFRMWVLGVLSCAVLSFLNQFFWYRKEPLS